MLAKTAGKLGVTALPESFNVYCDESCHLENDGQKAMVLGGVWCPTSKAREISESLREIKASHNLSSDFELKWTKVSPGKLQFYRDLLDYFFDDDDLHFRAVIIPDKQQLRHRDFNQCHDEWYYKMFFVLLKTLLDPQGRYFIYLDIKDTRSADKVRTLHKALINVQREVVQRIQSVASHEVLQLQLADLLIGAVSFANRDLDKLPESSPAKCELVRRMRERSHCDLKTTTIMREQKVNLLRWMPGESAG